MADQLAINDSVVESLRDTMRQGDAGLAMFPGLLRRVLEEGMWRKRKVRRKHDQSVVEFSSFEEFVTTAPLEGLGGTMEIIEKLARMDDETFDLLQSATVRPNRRPTKEESNTNGITSKPIQGNTKAAALRTLKKKAPELHAKVLAGELSAHAAMKRAGFRKDPKPLSVVKSVWKRASEEEREEIIDWLKGQR